MASLNVEKEWDRWLKDDHSLRKKETDKRS
eukprot:SAG22_NODE_22114_length_251_cov_0.927632_1_plen_29_part_01